jgi:two-component system chemotaxis response regulator CheY
MLIPMGQEDEFLPGDALRNAEILYVDDESQRRDAFQRVLLSLGAARVQVASGNEAVKVALATPCNLILAEYRLTSTDGIQLVRDLRQIVNYPRAVVPFLIVSEPVSTGVIAAAFEAGANHFLIKPLHPPKLYERLVWALGDSRPFVVKDGRYGIKHSRPALAGTAPRRAAATK